MDVVTDFKERLDVSVTLAEEKLVAVTERQGLAVRQEQQKLVALKRARELFDRSPDVVEFLTLMQKWNF